MKKDYNPSVANHYEILQVMPTASNAVIKAAYRILIQHQHPDKNLGQSAESNANEASKILNEAYRTLCDSQARAEYDVLLREKESNSIDANSSSAQPGSQETTEATNYGSIELFYPSKSLAAVVGFKPLPRTEVVKRVWEYIQKNNLQDEKNSRMVNSDKKLYAVFDGKKQVSLFEMTKFITDNLQLSPFNE